LKATLNVAPPPGVSSSSIEPPSFVVNSFVLIPLDGAP